MAGWGGSDRTSMAEKPVYQTGNFKAIKAENRAEA
jgi:hypothetical protein